MIFPPAGGALNESQVVPTKYAKSRAGSQTGESLHSSLESHTIFSRTQNSLHTISFFLTHNGDFSPLRDLCFMVLFYLQLFALVLVADDAFSSTPAYLYFFGFLRVDVALLTPSWFMVLFWAAFVAVLASAGGPSVCSSRGVPMQLATTGYVLLMGTIKKDSSTKRPWLVNLVRSLYVFPVPLISVPPGLQYFCMRLCARPSRSLHSRCSLERRRFSGVRQSWTLRHLRSSMSMVPLALWAS